MATWAQMREVPPPGVSPQAAYGTLYLPECFLAAHGFMEHGDPIPPCEGRLVRCHLLDKQELVRLGLDSDDPATWVWGCGGLDYGNAGHHGMFDHYRMNLPLEAVPKATIAYAIEHALESRLRRYK